MSGKIGKFLMGVLLAAVFAATASIGSYAGQKDKSANIKIAAAAQVLNVTVWAFGASDPRVKGAKVDIYSVTLKNASKPSQALDYVAVNLSARDHGQPAALETIIEASDGYPLVKAMPWVLRLKPGITKTVFFVTRSNGDQYCAGGTLLKPQKCTPHG